MLVEEVFRIRDLNTNKATKDFVGMVRLATLKSLSSSSLPPPSPPAPRSKIESMLEQILEGQQKILKRAIPI